jgi:protein-tyrosine phosphatase
MPLCVSRVLDAHEIWPGLWQGSAPLPGWRVSQAGFHALVLCAKEYQPDTSLYPGIQVVYAPNDDDFSRLPTREELKIALDAARATTELIQNNRKVLVTCRMGWNRSGLVSALTLYLLTGKSGTSCVAQVRGKRPKALGNPGFCEVLSRI